MADWNMMSTRAAAEYLARRQWPDTTPMQRAIDALRQYGTGPGPYTPVYAIRLLETRRIVSHIRAFIAAGKLTAYDQPDGHETAIDEATIVKLDELRPLLARGFLLDKRYERDVRAYANAWNDEENFERWLIKAHADNEAAPLLFQWFLHDSWTPREALRLLLGLEPDADWFALSDESGDHPRIVSARYLDGSLVCIEGWRNANVVKESIESGAHPEIYNQLQITSLELVRLSSELSGMKRVFESGSHAPRNPPAYYIEWAARKNYVVPWLNWARSEGLLVPVDAEAEVAPAEGTAEILNAAAPIETPSIANAFDGLNQWDAAKWAKNLGDGRAKWLKKARVGKGRKGAAAATWNPVIIALYLKDLGVPWLKLDAVFKKAALKEWRSKWEEQTEEMRD
ncbi:hypothetical protein G3N58_16115 [Paraburkholderia sp. Ac-20342]|uniref:hypothetical protein n=1 Tax=Paraburkholderia sp. Ac-20342 TaxID=2703889 RepID=UPI0019800548|nr:hypothetical protein [Paraburkholderia sp. Ac-20342]MBN3848344.1 hypothetical protein [Paraburkholderia sp. Ac-20342]